MPWKNFRRPIGVLHRAQVADLLVGQKGFRPGDGLVADALARLEGFGKLEGEARIARAEGAGHGVLAHPLDHLDGARTVPDQVAEADDLVHAALGQRDPDGSERVNVGMNV
jgi:hypothetical protein